MSEKTTKLRFKPYSSLENILQANPTFTGFIEILDKPEKVLNEMKAIDFRYKEIRLEKNVGSLNIVFPNVHNAIIPFSNRQTSLRLEDNWVTMIDNDALTCYVDKHGFVRHVKLKTDYALNDKEYFDWLLAMFFNTEMGRRVFLTLMRELMTDSQILTVREMQEKILEHIVDMTWNTEGYVYNVGAKYFIEDFELYDVIRSMTGKKFVDINRVNEIYTTIVDTLREIENDENVQLQKSTAYKPVKSSIISKDYVFNSASLSITFCVYTNSKHDLLIMKPNLKVHNKIFVTAWEQVSYAPWYGAIQAIRPFDLRACVVMSNNKDPDKIAVEFVQHIALKVLETTNNEFISLQPKSYQTVQEFLADLIANANTNLAETLSGI